MKIAIKVVIEKGDLNREYLNDFDSVEVQLLRESLLIDIETHLREIETRGIRISSIHTDYLPGAVLNVEDVVNDDYRVRLGYAMNLGNRVAELQGTDYISIVVHTDISPQNNPSFDTTIKSIVNNLNPLMEAYPRVKIAIENTMVIQTPRGIPYFVNGVSNSVEVYESLIRNGLDKSRICTVIDVCHAELNDKLIKLLSSIHPSMEELDRLEDLFRKSGPHCEVVHLADSLGFGFEEGNHGTGFKRNKASEERLKKYLRLIKEHCPKATIVIEVTEGDYVNRPDALLSKDMIDEILEEDDF